MYKQNKFNRDKNNNSQTEILELKNTVNEIQQKASVAAEIKKKKKKKKEYVRQKTEENKEKRIKKGEDLWDTI